MAKLSLTDRVKARTGAAPAPAAEVPEQVAGLTGGEQVEPAMHGTVMAWLSRYEQEFTDALPSHITPGSFLAAVRAILPRLASCTPASTLQALLTCARFGLLPDDRHAVIKREGKLAVFVPMAQGFIELMYRSGAVRSVHIGEIREQDEFTVTPTAPAPDDFVHRPDLRKTPEERGEVIYTYAFAWLKGGGRSQVILLSRRDAEDIRNEYSTAYLEAEASGARDSYWHTDFLKMWRKSGVRRLAKVVPMSAEVVALLKADDAGEAGELQITHAPDPEAAALLSEAEAASVAAEASQDVPAASSRPLPVKRSQPRRKGSRRARQGKRHAA
jgi:phage RecT family recombinase